jgi:hypothetical protein
MITQTTQASASQKPNHTHGKCGAMAFANDYKRLSQAKGVSGPLICEAKQIHVLGKVTSLCGYLLVTSKPKSRHNKKWKFGNT